VAAALDAAQRAETTGNYRTAPRAATAVDRGVFDCPHCQREVPTSEAMLTSAGMVCGPCFHAHVEERLLAEANRDHGELTDELKGAGRHAPEADLTRHAAYARAAVSLVGVLLDLGRPHFCERCGRRHRTAACPDA
jgi:hypothetical protein